MMSVATAAVLSCLLLQAPGDGWDLAGGTPGEVKHLYWELFDTSELWVQVSPQLPDGRPAPLRMVFQAFFKGPKPRAVPGRIGARVLGAVGPDLSFRLSYAERTVDLTGPEGNSHLLFPSGGTFANGVDAEIKPDVFRAFVSAPNPSGAAFGVPFTFSESDRVAVKRFAAEVGAK
jgi:hypothetical protein